MILYKYLNPERIDFLQDLKIRFTQAAFLNDPYETNHRCSEFVTQDLRTSIEVYKPEIVDQEQKYFLYLK